MKQYKIHKIPDLELFDQINTSQDSVISLISSNYTQYNKYLMSYLPPGQERCPLDPSHLIAKEKMVAHVQKCKIKNQSKTDKQQCQFNPLHWVNFTQIKQHEANCEDRESILSELHDKQQSHEPEISIIKPSEKNVFIKKEARQEKWKQPNFEQWFLSNYNKDGSRKLKQQSYNLNSHSESMFYFDFRHL